MAKKSLFNICAELERELGVQRTGSMWQKFCRLYDNGEITIDGNLMASDHPEIDKAVFEDRVYVFRLREGFRKLLEAYPETVETYQEFERRFQEYQKSKE